MNRLDLFKKIKMEQACLEVHCFHHPMEILRPRLKKLGAIMAKDLIKVPSGSKILISGLLIFFHTPPTRSGKRVIFATLEDETGIFDLTILPHIQEKWGRIIYESKILTASCKVKREGYQGRAFTITVEKLIPSFCL